MNHFLIYQDDSYLQTQNLQAKEESQRKMYDMLGIPCLQNVFQGLNTTVCNNLFESIWLHIHASYFVFKYLFENEKNKK